MNYIHTVTQSEIIWCICEWAEWFVLPVSFLLSLCFFFFLLPADRNDAPPRCSRVIGQHWFLLVSTWASRLVSEASSIFSISKPTAWGCPKAIHGIRIRTDRGFFNRSVSAAWRRIHFWSFVYCNLIHLWARRLWEMLRCSPNTKWLNNRLQEHTTACSFS